jgi:hypothetical protein
MGEAVIDRRKRARKADKRRRKLRERAAKARPPRTRPGEVTFLGSWAEAAAAWCQSEGVPHQHTTDAEGVAEVRLRPADLTARQRSALPAAVLAGVDGPLYAGEVPR